MLTIVEDTCGVHDFLLAPCCSMTMKHFYNMEGEHPSCLKNLYIHLAPYDIYVQDIPTAFNIFMNVEVKNYAIKVLPPITNPGDYITFKANMDLLIGLTTCSAKDSNNNKFSPIQYQIFMK